MTTYVIKRDYRKEPFDVQKVKKVIEWATSGLDVNYLVLESKFDEFISANITTASIHDNLIYHSRILCSPESPEWSIVAGRLEIMKRWKETMSYDSDLYHYIQSQIRSGIYKNPALATWTREEIEDLETELKQERDLEHTYGSILTAIEKYLLPNENIQHMFITIAMIIASIETRSKIEFAKKVYNALSLRKISLATPWLSNLRSDGNISSCFILQVDDNLESIADNWKNSAIISKNGGGIGIDFSRLRAKGSDVAGRANSSKGVTSWCKIFNDIMVSVDQGGKRAGACTIHVPIWHNDITDFIEIQTENGDFRKKSFDIFPQISIPDLFMQEAIKDTGGTWYTFCPHEVNSVLGISLYGVFNKEFESVYEKCIDAYSSGKLKIVTVYNAKSLLKEIMKVQFETGLPYLVFIDLINAHNPNNHDGYIPCSNLCTESYSNVVADKLAHTCNLASIVVGRTESAHEIIELAQLCTRILDNGIELTKAPVSIAAAHNLEYRTIGVGIQGLHDYIAKYNYNWKSYKEITELAELIEYGCVKESVKLAQERGAYPKFKGSQWDNGDMVHRFGNNSVTSLPWGMLQESIDEFGIRNSQLTSPAPNTSTSLFMDASAGVLPVYSGFYNEDNKTGKFPVFGMYIKENPMSYESTAARQDQSQLTKVIGSLQKFVDTGISAEYIFDQNKDGFSAKDLYDLIINAWFNENKAIYYIRAIKKGQTIDDVTGGESVCVGCTG